MKVEDIVTIIGLVWLAGFLLTPPILFALLDKLKLKESTPPFLGLMAMFWFVFIPLMIIDYLFSKPDRKTSVKN